MHVEGEAVPPSAYIRRLERLDASIERMFVMTDHHGQFAALRKLAPELEVTTLSEPAMRGYFQADFRRLPYDRRLASIRRLMAEVLVASRAKAFIGAFRSNVSRMVYMLHPDKARCVSIDSMTEWIAE